MLHNINPFIIGYGIAFAMLVAVLAAEVLIEIVKSKRSEWYDVAGK